MDTIICILISACFCICAKAVEKNHFVANSLMQSASFLFSGLTFASIIL